MNKNEAIAELLIKIYKDKGKTTLVRKQIKQIEKFYKDNYEKWKGKSFNRFISSDKEVKTLLSKTQSGYAEIQKQFSNQLALQPGILSECVFLETLAKILNLKDFYDINTSMKKIPTKFWGLINRTNVDDTSAARYLYCDKNNNDIVLIQYGNPYAGDAVAILYSNDIAIEIKDMPALVMDTDLIYNEQGKLNYPENKELSSYCSYIDKFNNETSVFDMFGKNYKLSDNLDDGLYKQNMISNFFNHCGLIDLIITSTPDDELVGFKTSDLNFVFPDGVPLLDTGDSEIRTTGKNHKRPFTPEYLNTILNKIDVIEDSNGICTVSKDNVLCTVSGRGKSSENYSRVKLSYAFIVMKSDIISDKDDVFVFKKSSIRQNKPGISIHIKLNKSKDEIGKALNYNGYGKKLTSNNCGQYSFF